MPDPVTLRIFFFGLLAFVVDDPTYPSKVEVVLLDARNPPPATDGCPIHVHIPALFYRAASCEHPCRREGRLCACELDREEIEISLTSRSNASGRPGKQQAQVFEYLACMWKIQSKIGEIADEVMAAIHHGAEHSEYHHPLRAAALKFDLSGSGVCKLAGERHHATGHFEAPRYRFLPLTSELPFWRRWLLSPQEQELADIVFMETKVQPDGQGDVVLEIRASDDTASYDVNLGSCWKRTAAAAGAGGAAVKDCEIVIANIPRMGDGHDDYGRCTHTIARDFELYHDLAGDPILLYDRPIPQEPVMRSMKSPRSPFCDSTVLRAFLMHLERRGSEPPICPMTTYLQ